jgi:hypothetical protein
MTGQPEIASRRDASAAYLRAIIEALLPDDEPSFDPAAHARLIEDVGCFVQGQLDELPRRLRFMYAFGMTGFRLCVFLRYLRRFHSLTPARRRSVVRLWAYGPWGLARSLFRVVRTTALLNYYESPMVQAALLQDSPEEQPARMEAR